MGRPFDVGSTAIAASVQRLSTRWSLRGALAARRWRRLAIGPRPQKSAVGDPHRRAPADEAGKARRRRRRAREADYAERGPHVAHDRRADGLRARGASAALFHFNGPWLTCMRCARTSSRKRRPLTAARCISRDGKSRRPLGSRSTGTVPVESRRNVLQHSARDSIVEVTVRDDHEYAALDVNNAHPRSRPIGWPTSFDPFHRGQKARSTCLGLGLYIVERIVHAHGASIAARSTHDEGTTFEVRLPRRRARDRDGARDGADLGRPV